MVSDGALMSATDYPPFGFHVHDSTSLYCGTAYRRLWLLWSGLTYVPCPQFLKHEYSYSLSLYHIIAVDKLYSTSLVQCEQWNNLHDKLVVALLITRNWQDELELTANEEYHLQGQMWGAKMKVGIWLLVYCFSAATRNDGKQIRIVTSSLSPITLALWGFTQSKWFQTSKQTQRYILNCWYQFNCRQIWSIFFCNYGSDDCIEIWKYYIRFSSWTIQMWV
jgi:hypothetical protein